MTRKLRELLEQSVRQHPDRTCFRTAVMTASYQDALNESHRQARFISSELRVSNTLPLGVSTIDPARLLHVVWGLRRCRGQPGVSAGLPGP